jgi:PAS domain S-box-containing protein
MNDASGPLTAGAVYTTDADGFITLYNEAAVSLWGRKPEVGKDRWCGSHRLYRSDGTPLPLDASPSAVALKEGRPIQGLELVIERPDGTRRRVVARSEPIHDSEGGMVGAINTFADMTPHMRMEILVAGQQKALQMAVHGAALGDVLEVLTRTIETHATDGVIASILTLDRDGIHLRHGAGPNLPEPYKRAIDGVAIGPSVGSCGTAAFRNDTVIVDDIAADPLWADFRTVALEHGLRACWSMPIRSSRREVLGTFALYYKQVRNPAPQDREVVELLAHTAAVILERDREGRERRNAEASLRESEAHYRALMEQAHDSIFVCDGEGRFLVANSAASRLLGYSLEELLLVRVRDTCLESDVDASERRLHEVKAGHSLRFERTMVRKDRSTFEADISLTRMPNGQVYAMVRDITDRKHAEDTIRMRTEHMRLLSEALAQLLNARDPETIVRELFPKVAAHLHIDTYVNFMVDETGQALRLHSCAGIPDEVARSVERLEFGQAISGTVAQLREPIIANDIQRSGYERAALVRSFGIQSYVCNPLIAGGRLLGTLSFASRTRPSFDHDEIEFLRVISQYTAVALDRLHTTKALGEHSRSLEILNRVGSTLAAELDLNTLVQTVTDAGREVSGADFGAFFYNVKDERGESYTLYTLSGVPREAFEKFPMPRNTALFGPTFRGEGVIRIDDVLADPRYGHSEPYRGMPKGHLPVRSYLAVPVTSRSGQVLGGLFFGHAEPGVFTEEAEKILVGIASQASIAIDNASLYKAVQKELAEHKRIEEALRESEEKFRTMADNIAQFAWMADEQGRIFWYNQRWFDYTGTTLEEMEGWGWKKVHHPDHIDRVVQKIRRCFETGEFWEDTFPLRGHDGNYRWFLSRAIPIRGANGKVLRWFGTNTDVSAQREAETALRQSEGLYRAIGESNDYGIWVCDALGRNTYASESFLRLVGLTQKECSEFGWGRVLHPDDVERTISAWKECVQAGGVWDCEHRFRGVDGRYHPILARGVPVRDANGHIIGWAGINLDISSLKQAQEDLHEKSVRLLVALGASHTGTFQWNLRTDELTWDEPLDRLLGLSSGQTIRSLEQFLDMIHPADHDAIVRACERCRTEGGDFEAEFRVVWPDGTIRWLYDRGKTIFLGEDGRPEYMTGACVDITERKQAEEQLRELTVELEQRVKERTDELTRSQERLRALATEVTLTEQRERRRIASELHDYLAQLLVVGRMKLTQGRKRNRDEQQEVWLKELDQLLDQSLTYTRSLVAQLSPPVLHEFGLVKAFHWLAEAMQHQGLSVDVQAQDLFLTLPEDKAVLLYQSVRELLFNVVKHARADRASISVQVTPEHELRITVMDQGEGFDPAATMTTEPLSTGYGLFSIRERMAVMGGTLTLISAPRQGTRVMIAIPYRHLVEMTSVAPVSGVQPDSRTGSTARPIQNKTGVVRVLLVDDHAMVRQGLRSILDSYEDIAIVGEAGDGLAAVGLVNSLIPDVVVMDLNMPKMDGIEATRRIMQAVPGIVVVGLSVRNDREAEQAMRSAGASGYLTKECAADQLHEAICQATKRVAPDHDRSN